MSLDIANNLKEMIDFLKEQNLNVWEETFIDDIENIVNDENGFMTERQIEKLNEIFEKYN